MSDDVLFIAVGAAGALFGLWRVMAGRLAPALAGRILASAGVGLFGALAWDGIRSVADGGEFLGHRADLGASALLFLVMALPLWALFDERILARVSEIGIASIGFAAAYQLADRVDGTVAIAVAVASIVVAILVARTPGGGWRRLLGYGWFLSATVVLAITEADHALDPLVEEIVEVHPGPVFAAFAAMLWLAFHGMFAAKLILIVLTCHRRRGRQLAYDFSARMVAPGGSSPAAIAAVLGVEGSILLSDHLLDWADNVVVVAVVIFTLPVVERLTGPAVGHPETVAAGVANAAWPADRSR